jgi:hypothetical protein
VPSPSLSSFFVKAAQACADELLKELAGQCGVGSVGLFTKSTDAEAALKNASVESVTTYRIWTSMQRRLNTYEAPDRFYSESKKN